MMDTQSSLMSAFLSVFWKKYNSSDSVLPLLIPMIIWVSTYSYCRVQKQEFHRWYSLHNFHNFGAMGLGLVSLYFDNDAIFNERIPTLFSIGYFIVDVVDTGLRRDSTYFFHATCCLFLGVSNASSPLFRKLRMNSKATFLELSNPFMHLVKRTKKPEHMALFAAVFTVVRIIWLPILVWQLLQNEVPVTDPRLLCVSAFYMLNLFWYFKILNILYQGAVGGGSSTIPKKEV